MIEADSRLESDWAIWHRVIFARRRAHNSEAIKSWPATLRLVLLGLAWSHPAALIAWLAR
jgi:hypothetical protein